MGAAAFFRQAVQEAAQVDALCNLLVEVERDVAQILGAAWAAETVSNHLPCPPATADSRTSATDDAANRDAPQGLPAADQCAALVGPPESSRTKQAPCCVLQ